MLKLTLFALTLTAILAFSTVSAYRTTIVTTTIDDNGVEIPPYFEYSPDNPKGTKEQCSSQTRIKKLNHCQKHLTESIFNGKLKMVLNKKEEQHLQQCCKQLKKVSPQCQCEAIQRVYAEARQQGGVDATEQIASIAERLPNDCGLEVQDCPLPTPYV